VLQYLIVYVCRHCTAAKNKIIEQYLVRSNFLIILEFVHTDNGDDRNGLPDLSYQNNPSIQVPIPGIG
jgi:hypothetical protein